MEYDDITNRIKEQKPILDNPEKLTLSVLEKIERSHVRKPGKIFQITGILSGAAACMLICIFVYETFHIQAPEKEKITRTFLYKENLIQKYNIENKQDFLLLIGQKLENRQKKIRMKENLLIMNGY